MPVISSTQSRLHTRYTTAYDGDFFVATRSGKTFFRSALHSQRIDSATAVKANVAGHNQLFTLDFGFPATVI